MKILREDLKKTDFSDITTGEGMRPLHPGVFLREIIEEFALSQARLADMVGVSPMRISHVMNGTRSITAELALKFGELFGQTPEYWLSLQSSYDLEKAGKSPDLDLEAIRKTHKWLLSQSRTLSPAREVRASRHRSPRSGSNGKEARQTIAGRKTKTKG